MKILGFIIDTTTMTISVEHDRVLDILSELQRIRDRKAVRRSDLESLVGKMSFICSVVPGGRTFMREILNLLHSLKKRSHWAHLSFGFRCDLEWWLRFASGWNGIEAIPPAVSRPASWFYSDASGEEGLGLFFCGAGIHVPLPLASVSSPAESDLIIAETELIAAVVLVALAGSLCPGQHVVLGVDNTVAIAWIDKGICSRPRAMLALRILWRIQAFFRVYVSVRYVTSANNALADAASRCDVTRFANAASLWSSSNSVSLRQFGVSEGYTSLVAVEPGPSGGAAGLLVERLVQGHHCRLRDTEGEMDGILGTFSALAPRLVAQQSDRLHNVSGDNCQEGPASGLLVHQSLCGLLGQGRVLYQSRSAEPSAAPRGEALSSRSSSHPWEGEGESGTVHSGAPAPTNDEISAVPDSRDAHGSAYRSAGLLGLSSPWESDSEVSREPVARALSEGRDGDRPRSGLGDPRFQDDPVPRAGSFGGGARPSRPALVPIARISPVDLALATPVIPDEIVRAVFDRNHHALTFEVPQHCEQAYPPFDAALRPLVSSRIRSPRDLSRHSHRPSHAAWRLEVARSRDVVWRGFHDSEPAGQRDLNESGVDPPY